MSIADPSRREAARDAGLHWSTDARPGIRRRRAGRGWTYRDPAGDRVGDVDVLARIRALAIPPAWTDVWICTDPRGHLQATGRDARNRKQYRYHAAYRASRDRANHDRMLDVARRLPRIRERVDADLARRGIPREKVLAAVVRLLELTLIRVGNDEYARLNRSFGLTTMQGRHAQVDGERIRFRFRGKSGVKHEVRLRDRRLARVVARCQELPGQDLFEYVDEAGEVCDVRSEDVNAYLREASGADVTAKDFRTWAGTVLAYRALVALQHGETEGEARHNVVEAVRQAAASLGNTPAVTRRSYVHPAVVEAYLDGQVRGADDERPPSVAPDTTTAEDEAAVQALLRRRGAAGARRTS